MKSGVLLLLMACMAIVACKDSKAGPTYTKTVVSFNAGTAEEIRDSLLVLPLLRMAEVMDGRAILYHQAPREEVQAELARAQASWHVRMGYGLVREYDGDLPQPLEAEPVSRLVFQPDREALQRYGLTLGDVAEQTRDWLNSGLGRTQGQTAHQFLDTQSFRASDGRLIPWQQLGTLQVEEVMRPLIIEVGRAGS